MSEKEFEHGPTGMLTEEFFIDWRNELMTIHNGLIVELTRMVERLDRIAERMPQPLHKDLLPR